MNYKSYGRYKLVEGEAEIINHFFLVRNRTSTPRLRGQALSPTVSLSVVEGLLLTGCVQRRRGRNGLNKI